MKVLKTILSLFGLFCLCLLCVGIGFFLGSASTTGFTESGSQARVYNGALSIGNYQRILQAVDHGNVDSTRIMVASLLDDELYGMELSLQHVKSQKSKIEAVQKLRQSAEYRVSNHAIYYPNNEYIVAGHFYQDSLLKSFASR
jgi:hypothetical protein